MKIKLSLFLILLFLTLNFICGTTFGQKIKNSGSYFSTPTKVGLYVKTEIANNQHIGSGGLIGAALSSTRSSSKYDEPLKFLDPQLNPSAKIKEVYKDIYSGKGKSISIIDENLDSLKLTDFENPKTGKKYYKKDLRPLKEKFNVDEILIVFVEYGIRVGYSYGIENSRLGMASIRTEIINLNDNSYIIREETDALERIHGG